MPSYVCPECGASAIDSLVIINGTMMHFDCAIMAGKIPPRPRISRPPKWRPPRPKEAA